MELTRLDLTNFRSYEKKVLSFNKYTTVLVGPNAVGKTNILEAIYLLASGESFRAEKIEEMVMWEREVGHVSGQRTDGSGREIQLQVTLTRGMVQGRKTQKRFYKVNGVGKRRLDFAGNLTAVIFRPEDVAMVTGSPSGRRNFLNRVLLQADREYRRSFFSYEKGLRRRNKLLTQIRNGSVPRTTLAFWDQLLIRDGGIITKKRQELVDFINASVEIESKRRLTYDYSVISTGRLAQYSTEEVAAGHTLVGPHRDDFSIFTSDKLQDTRDLAKYGSRGEQRMAVVWLKIAELDFLTEKLNERPLLLLDDIFSELDTVHDRLVMNLLGKQQTLVTTTDTDSRFKDVEELEIVEL